MRTAFVTGAAGFSGRHLVEVLRRENWAISAFCRATDRVDVLSTDVRIVSGELADAEGLREATEVLACESVGQCVEHCEGPIPADADGLREPLAPSLITCL